MKKTISLFLVLALILPCIFVHASANKISSEISASPLEGYILPENVVCGSTATVIRDDTTGEFAVMDDSTAFSASPYAVTRLEFAGVNPDVAVIGSDNIVISSGETSYINITTCDWSPEHYIIHVGFWNINTNYTQFYELTGGWVTDEELEFSNMPAGTYRVYVENTGSSVLTTGIMRYTVS